LIVFLLESVHNKGVNIMQVLEASTRIAHYCLQRRIARGGMSHVYLAQDIFTEQLVALKLVDKNQSEYYERLQREIRALADLTHNHILPTLDYGPYHSWYYLVTPYIEHGTLRERLVQGPLTIKEAGSILEQVASALQFAHDRGISIGIPNPQIFCCVTGNMSTLPTLVLLNCLTRQVILRKRDVC